MPDDLAQQLLETSRSVGLEHLEAGLLGSTWEAPAFFQSSKWAAFIKQVAQAWHDRHSLVVRGVPTDNGATTLLVALSLNSHFKPYRENKIVKHFKMSPWTTELSQTIQEGHFHTDLNTSPTPPAATVIHCHKPDPNPEMGESRVVVLDDLLNELERRSEAETLAFLTEAKVDMVDERKRGSWSGSIIEGDTIRFHPETLRAAAQRLDSLTQELEHHLTVIHESAMAVSEPIHLAPGDALFVSNRRALHYRGECTVQFAKFPRQFFAREIYVLHLQDEPQWKV
ncbi:TauD/TfdA family dioxygenase [Marinobacterium weihaiense]|uniref:TauD/TfdA family dioxygenase n=1 Tax=Marinobacterium weihaiense TaxID=2851016 RepID=A0ABS6MF18_9GAMM|nr:TauD/TfdA family dioxygenase [Marinobacterium weihaiense]MBV0934889.1 TauD/TfdA family dioxygenase [Marinobacterium weihaiense]